jgi:hypothetical protein
MDSRSHAALREQLPSYVANQLTPSERAVIERHIASCADCRAELDEWLMLGEWLAQDSAAIPPDTSAASGLAAIHARLRQLPAYSLDRLDSLDGFDSFDGFERSALSTMSNQDFHHNRTDQNETLPSLSNPARTPPTPLPGGGLSRAPLPPQRRVNPLLAGGTALVFIALVASLFYLLAPQLRPHQTALSPTPTATTPLTPTPKPLSGSWHTAPNAPTTASNMQFAKSAPQIGYLCGFVDIGSDSAPTSSSHWLYKTSDGGMTWRPVGGLTLTNLASAFCQVFIDANDASDVFVQLVCDSSGPSPCESLWRSRDGGATWRQLSMPHLPWGWANIVVVGSRIVGMGTDDSLMRDPRGPFCTTDPKTTSLHQINDLFASDDGGKTWKQIGQPLINQGLSILPGGVDGFVFGVGGSQSLSLLSYGSALFVRTYCLVGPSGEARPQQTYWRSSNGGETWVKLPTPDSVMYLTPSATGGAYGVAVSPGVNIVRADLPTILYSRDSGVSWSALPSLGSIPLPPQIKKNAPGCGTTCPTYYGAPLAIALPDGSVLVEFRVNDAKTNASNASLDALYTIDPLSPNPVWRQFAPVKVGSKNVGWLINWPLAATRQGFVLWAIPDEGMNPLTGVYLSPLP